MVLRPAPKTSRRAPGLLKGRSRKKAPPAQPLLPPVPIATVDDQDALIRSLQQRVQYLEEKLSKLSEHVYVSGPDVVIRSRGDLILEADSDYKLEARNIAAVAHDDYSVDCDEATVSASSSYVVETGTLDLISATANIDSASTSISAATTTAGGVITCDTIIATNVVGTNYTPGAGNIA